MTKPAVLVTGATGLIGRQLPAPLSALGFKVIATSRRGGGDLVAMDCLDPSSVGAVMERLRPSHLIHLAWHDGAKDRWSSSANLDWVGASLALLSAFARSGGRRAVMVGSCAEYDWSQAASGPLREDAALRPATLYGAAKVATGTAALAGAGALGVSLAWARPFFCYGPGEPEGRLFGDLIKGIAAGRIGSRPEPGAGDPAADTAIDPAADIAIDRVGGGGAAQGVGLIRCADKLGIHVLISVNSNGRAAAFLDRTNDAQGNLAAVCDQNLRGCLCGH